MVFYKYHLSSPHSPHSTHKQYKLFKQLYLPLATLATTIIQTWLLPLAPWFFSSYSCQQSWPRPTSLKTSIQIRGSVPREWDSPSYVLAPVPSLARCSKPERIYLLTGTYRVWHCDSPRLGSHHRAQCDSKCCGTSARLSSSSWSGTLLTP
jgi:hypothetical protein